MVGKCFYSYLKKQEQSSKFLLILIISDPFLRRVITAGEVVLTRYPETVEPIGMNLNNVILAVEDRLSDAVATKILEKFDVEIVKRIGYQGKIRP